MKTMQKWLSMGLVAAILGGAGVLYAGDADAEVRIVRRSSTCFAPGYYAPRRHEHTYTYQQQRIFIGYDQCGYPVYEIRYVRVRTCGCR